MLALGPYETHPFHPPALFTVYTMINVYIYSKLFQLFLTFGICIVPWEFVDV